MSRLAFLGTWKVIKCEYSKGASIGNYDRQIETPEGIKFHLNENGDVTWIVPDELKSIPLFSCDTYDYEHYFHDSRFEGVVGLRFGAYAGHVFEFYLDKPIPEDSMKITCEGLCVLHCLRVTDDMPENTCNFPFTLLPALEDGYFSDVTISSSNNKQFKVHSTILELQGDGIDWSTDPPPFTNLSEEVLGTILHFLYCECLPDNVTEETARQVITIATAHASLSKLVAICQSYLKNITLKQQIMGLVNDMHFYMNQIIDRFNSRSSHDSPENPVTNPERLCFAVKQSIRDAAVVGAKLLLLCDLFTKRKTDLSKNERHEIIHYAKSRLPIFLTQLTRFVQVFKNTFGSMTPTQRVEIATFLVPEIEAILDTVSMLVVHIEKALQQIIQALFTQDVTKSKSSEGDMLSKTLSNLSHIRELTKLNTFHEHITCSLGLLVHKKDNFNQMSPSQKVRSISRNLEQLIDELPVLLIRLEERAAVFDEKLEWRDFKFCFKVGTSRVSDILDKLLLHIDSLQDVMQQVCELVQRDTFTQALQSLDLLTASAFLHTKDAQKPKKSPSYSMPTHSNYKFNLVESFYIPPEASNSDLSNLCLQLLTSEKKADMEFEILGSSNFNPEHNDACVKTNEENCVIKAHRVIVAARCDWFRRALMSGMREAIDKKIIIHDTSPFLFRILLEYLYTGKLKRESLSTEQVVELLLLSDRYEIDCLKQTCEQLLMPCIDVESVLYFLSTADQYNARTLRIRCLHFISLHHDLTETEEFFELPLSLQAEIFDCVWTQPGGRQSDILSYEHLHSLSSGSSNSLRCSSPGVTDLTKAVESMLLTPRLDSRNSSLEDLQMEQNSSRMDTFLNEMRDIVGESAPRDVLVQVILAADFDLRRAVNYYYGRSSTDQ